MALVGFVALAGCTAGESGPTAPTTSVDDGLPVVPFPDTVVLGADGARPGAELTPATPEAVTARTWRLLDPAAGLKPYYAASDLFVSLTFDGQRWAVRDCGLEMSAPGSLSETVEITGGWQQVADPDPGASCTAQANAGGWRELLESSPAVHLAGEALALSRTAYPAEWDPTELQPVPVALTQIDAEGAAATAAWAEAVGSGGPAYDYDPLASPEDAFDRADLVVAGEVTGWTRPAEGTDEPSVVLSLRVTEVLGGDASPGDVVDVEVAVGPTAVGEIRRAPDPTGPVVAVLARGDGASWQPFVDGLWLQGSDSPVSTHADVQDLRPGWRYRDSVQALAADLAHAAP